MTIAQGKALRLTKARNGHGIFFFLAADHQLSNGRVAELADYSKWLSLVNGASELSGIVLNLGATRFVQDDFRKEVILQVMGSPSPGGDSLEKIRTVAVREALRVGANVISTQLNFEEPTFRRQLEVFVQLRREASEFGLPVLAMVNLRDRTGFDVQRFTDYATYASELGSDLIKLNLPLGAADHVDQLRRITANLPPILLSGAEKDASFLELVRLSRECGFSGLCVGRNIFRDDNPRQLVQTACELMLTRN